MLSQVRKQKTVALGESKNHIGTVLLQEVKISTVASSFTGDCLYFTKSKGESLLRRYKGEIKHDQTIRGQGL